MGLSRNGSSSVVGLDDTDSLAGFVSDWLSCGSPVGFCVLFRGDRDRSGGPV